MCPLFLSGDASLLTDPPGHPGGLGRHAVVSGRHAGQRGITGPTPGSAQSVDVELDPGERAPSFPEPPWRERSATTAGGEGHQGSHLPGPGRRPAPQHLLVVIGENDQEMRFVWPSGRDFLRFYGKSVDNPYLCFKKWRGSGPWTFPNDQYRGQGSGAVATFDLCSAVQTDAWINHRNQSNDGQTVLRNSSG